MATAAEVAGFVEAGPSAMVVGLMAARVATPARLEAVMEAMAVALAVPASAMVGGWVAMET